MLATDVHFSSVMSRYSKTIFLSLALLQCTSLYVGGEKISFQEIFAKEHIKEKLKLFEPKVLLKNYNQSHISKACARALSAYEQGIHKQELWALQMEDSSSKVPPGIFSGNLIDLGMYDECISASNKYFKNNIEIRGQHCMYSVNPTIISTEREFFFNPILSICLPEKCDSNDLVGLVNETIHLNSELMSSATNVSYAACMKPIDLNIDKGFIFFLAIMGLYIGFLSVCTILDVLNSSNQSKEHNSLIQFSYLKNAKAIFSMELTDNDLPPIHGLRALNTLWLIIVHECFFYTLSPLANFFQILERFESWSVLIPTIGLYSVDTFLVLSGFLTSIAFFKQRQKNQSFNVLHYYLQRIIRLAPSVASALYITTILGPKIRLIASGPRMDWLQNIFIESCSSKWLSVLLFIPNLVDQDNYCLAHLWSVAVDVQLMWISPLILYALHKKPKVGISLTVILLFCSVLSYAYILGVNKFPAIYFTNTPSIAMIMQAFQKIYEMPYTRASPWLLGILFGYMTAKKTSNPSKVMLHLGWVSALASFSFCVIGTKTFTSKEYEYNLPWEITFAALAKPFWGFGICWIIYASISNPRGLIARILSSKYFLPFSRMSYSLCIIHFLFPGLQAMTTKMPRYYSDFSIFHSLLSNLVLDLVFAFLFSTTFEMPMRNIGNIIFRKKNYVSQDKLKNK